MTGMVLNIERFATHDGPGIRTVVFLKGCPLRCVWCHTPESQRPEEEILFQKVQCVSCGRCAKVCPNDCHRFPDGKHRFDRKLCTACGRCAVACPIGVLSRAGTAMTPEQVIAEVKKDHMFYDESGGGMTVSGGEALFQADFTRELLKQAKALGISSCVETCGYGDYAGLHSWLPYIDTFLFDWKATDPALHQRLTGVDSSVILENLEKLNDAGAKIILRCPLIPGVNDGDEHLRGIARLAERLENVREIDLEPYNPLGMERYDRLGRTPPLKQEEFPAAEQVELWRKVIVSATAKPVIIP